MARLFRTFVKAISFLALWDGVYFIVDGVMQYAHHEISKAIFSMVVGFGTVILVTVNRILDDVEGRK